MEDCSEGLLPVVELSDTIIQPSRLVSSCQQWGLTVRVLCLDGPWILFI